MGRFSRKIKRNPNNGFVGIKKQRKLFHKRVMKEQQQYWKMFTDGLINRDGEPVEQEENTDNE